MQTLLTNSPAAPTATAADKSAVLTANQDGGEGALQSDGKVGFSEVMNRVQQADKVNAKADGKVANAGGKAPMLMARLRRGPAPSRGMLVQRTATSRCRPPRARLPNLWRMRPKRPLAPTTNHRRGARPTQLAPNDFLQRLQDALKQDTSLVAPPAINLVATAPVVETEGKMLPQEDADAESAEASATLTQPLAGSSDKQGLRPVPPRWPARLPACSRAKPVCRLMRKPRSRMPS